MTERRQCGECRYYNDVWEWVKINTYPALCAAPDDKRNPSRSRYVYKDTPCCRGFEEKEKHE